MPTAPLFRRGDTVYLRESAEIGKLEAFKITSIKQVVDGRWVYEINIGKKPPAQGLIGDTWDARFAEPNIAYLESELIEVCEAIDIAVVRTQLQINGVQNRIDTMCPEDPITTPLDAPRWAIGDQVFFDASARTGFLQCARVTKIFEVGIQPGSRRTRYQYVTDLRALPRDELCFREDELVSFCQAAPKVLSSLQRDLAEAQSKQAALCTP